MTATHEATPVWTVLRGPLDPAALRAGVAAIAARHHLRLTATGPTALELTTGGAEPGERVPQATVRWRAYTPDRPDTLGHVVPGAHLEILLDHQPDADDVAAELTSWLATSLRRFHPDELDHIAAGMPLLARFTPAPGALEGWAVIFRDHYVENTLGFLLALHRAGVPTQWIYALAKGDRTHNRDRVHATLLHRGYRSGLLDNTAINAPATHVDELAQATAQVDAFIDDAHTSGRKVLVIDDGGLLAQGYGHFDAPRRVDAALELTVSGLKRITAAGPLAVPVLDLARSQLKTRLGYPEIADSCLRRLRALLPAVKVTGRTVLVLGHGTLGSRLAEALHHQGCRVTVVDPDPLSLITAAEAGHTTFRTAGDALRTTRPMLVVGTSGFDALTVDDLLLLPTGAYLAPFATRDFSLLADEGLALPTTEIPGVGRRYVLPGGATVTMLGDGRSLNLFGADAIPNQGYDAYRAGTLIAATALCERADSIPGGVHTDLTDEIIRESGLYEAYYDTYLSDPGELHDDRASTTTLLQPPAPAAATLSACVIGYGAAGKLHAEILAGRGATLTILDPKYQDLPKAYRGFPHGVDELPAAIGSTIDLWSVCCPTPDHLPVLRSILRKDPAARVLLEKPACQAHEIGALTALLASHRNARITIIDQYRHARALDVLSDLMARYEPDAAPDHIAVSFSKDRTGDISRGRFVDRSYGVLGYEWLHMLAILRRLLAPAAIEAYLAAPVQESELSATYDPRLFVASLTERSTIAHHRGPLRIELTSTITAPTVVLGSTPDVFTSAPGQWRRGLRPADDRQRHVSVHAGATKFTVHLDPVTAADGWQLARNTHRVTVERHGTLLHDEAVTDSPLHTAVSTAADALHGERSLPAVDLAPLHRIAALAELLRVQQPNDQRPSAATA